MIVSKNIDFTDYVLSGTFHLFNLKRKTNIFLNLLGETPFIDTG